MSSRAFNCIVSSNKDLRNRVFWHRSKGIVLCKTRDSIIPTMRSKDPINIVRSINFNILFALVNINTNVVINQT